MESKNLVELLSSVTKEQAAKHADLCELLRSIGENPKAFRLLQSLRAQDDPLGSKPLQKHKRGGRHKKWHKPSAGKLRQDFTNATLLKPELNAMQIVDKMKTFHTEYASIPSSTIVRWLAEFRISIKELKRGIEAQNNRAR
jgi:hypothetical protein